MTPDAPPTPPAGAPAVFEGPSRSSDPVRPAPPPIVDRLHRRDLFVLRLQIARQLRQITELERAQRWMRNTR